MNRLTMFWLVIIFAISSYLLSVYLMKIASGQMLVGDLKGDQKQNRKACNYIQAWFFSGSIQFSICQSLFFILLWFTNCQFSIILLCSPFTVISSWHNISHWLQMCSNNDKADTILAPTLLTQWTVVLFLTQSYLLICYFLLIF